MPTIFRTLRFRVAGAFLLWTALFQAGLVLLLPLIRERLIYGEIDGRLERAAAEVAAEMTAGTSTPDDVVAPHVGPRGDGFPVLFQIRLADGRTLVPPRLTPHPLEIPAPGPGRATAQTVFETIPGATPVRYRTFSVPFTAPGGASGSVTAAASLMTADLLEDILRWMLLATLIPGLLGAAIAGWIVAGLTAARIEEIGRAVRAISASRLDQRIHITGDDEIRHMADDLNAMLDRLASTIRGLERFMSEVSHELKTPVSALLAEVQAMRYTTPTADMAKQLIASVEDEMRRLGKLVESFLMLARLEHGRRYLAERTVQINDVVLDAVEHATRPAEQSGISISLNLYDAGQEGREALVRGDAELLRIVLDNLLRNAIGFSDRGSTVSVSVDADGHDIRIGVRDRGPGAPPEHIDKIFERYAQAPNQKPGRRGTGLGLAIAKGVVELHHGTIRAENHPEGGCVFIVTLPLAQPSADPGMRVLPIQHATR